MKFRKLEGIEAPLANKFYKALGAGRNVSKYDQVFVACNESEIVACCFFQSIDDLQFLTGVLVAPQHRGNKVAERMLGFSLEQLKGKAIVSFPYTYAIGLYEKLGFMPVAPDELPLNLLGRFQAYTRQGKKLRVMKRFVQRPDVLSGP